jgi:hypothetical protein
MLTKIYLRNIQLNIHNKSDIKQILSKTMTQKQSLFTSHDQNSSSMEINENILYIKYNDHNFAFF